MHKTCAVRRKAVAASSALTRWEIRPSAARFCNARMGWVENWRKISPPSAHRSQVAQIVVLSISIFSDDASTLSAAFHCQLWTSGALLCFTVYFTSWCANICMSGRPHLYLPFSLVAFRVFRCMPFSAMPIWQQTLKSVYSTVHKFKVVVTIKIIKPNRRRHRRNHKPTP